MARPLKKPVVLALSLVIIGACLFAVKGTLSEILGSSKKSTITTAQNQNIDSHVLGTTTKKRLELTGDISFNIPTSIKSSFSVDGTTTLGGNVIGKDINIDVGKGSIFGSNLLYGLQAGPGITLSEGQTPTISNTGVTSFQGLSGELNISAGPGILINKDTNSNTLFLASNAVTDTGFSQSGNSVTTSKNLGVGSTISGGVLTGGFQVNSSGAIVRSSSIRSTGTVQFDYLAGGGIIKAGPNGVLTGGKALLGVDTEGSYITSLTGSSTIGVSDGTSPTLSLIVPTSGSSSVTSSNSGLEIGSDGVALLRGCGDGQSLQWDSSALLWKCASVSGIELREGATTYTNNTLIDVAASDFSLSHSGTTSSLSIDYANSQITRKNQNETITGTWAFGNLSVNTITSGVWNGGAIGIAYGGTGATTATNARSNLGAASRGVNSDITALTGLTTALSVGQGGTGLNTVPGLDQIMVGTGTGYSLSTITPGTGIGYANSGGVLTLSNTGVTSFQGGTGAVTLSAGNGINVTGTTIANTGVTSLAGTANQINVSSATGAVTLSLPQNLSTTSDATFNSVTTSNGQLKFGANGTLVWTPTAPRTVTIPDDTGTVCLSTGNCASLGASTTNSGTSNNNEVAIFTSNSNITSVSTFYYNRTNNRLGIGTNSPNATLSVGANKFTVDGTSGNASTVGTYTTDTGVLIREGGSTPTLYGTINVADLSSGQTYTFPDQSGVVCLTSGNCVGLGGGITTTGGTTDKLAKFTGAQAINDSIITDNGTLVSVGGNFSASGTVTFSSLTTGILKSSSGSVSVGAVNLNSSEITSILQLANGGTGANTAAGARSNLGAAAAGSNSDITSLSGLTTALSIGQGGTGTANAPTNGKILIGNASGGYTVATLTQGTGIGITNGNGSITVANTGVTSFQSLTGAVTLTEGSGITITGTTIANSGVTSLNSLTSGVTLAGAGINSLSVSGSTLTLTGTEADTLASVSARGNSTSTGLSLVQNGNLASSYGLQLLRNTDSGSQGYFIQALNAAANANLFSVDTSGKFTSASNSLTFGGTGTLSWTPTASRSVVIPDADGTVCMSTGNCSGTGAGIGGSGTNGQLAFWNGTYNIGADSALFWDNVNKRLSLGAGSSPSYKLDLLSSDTTGLMNLVGNSITTGTGFNMSLNGLTTGTGFSLNSTSTALTTGSLMNLSWIPGSATTASGDLFSLNIGSNGNIGSLFNIKDNGNSLFKVTESNIVNNLPVSFNAPGDLSVAYDLMLTNQNSSFIKSNAGLTLESGESFESNDLTLRTFGSGQGVFDFPGGLNLLNATPVTLASSTTALNFASGLFNLDTTNTRIGFGTAAPSAAFHYVAPASVTGTGTISSSGTTVTGSSSAFNTQLAIGDTITASGQTRIITAIASATSLTTDTAFSPVISAGTSFTFNRPITKVVDNTGTTQFMQAANGYVGLGVTAPTARLEATGSGSTLSTYSLKLWNSSSSNLLSVRDDGVVNLGTSPEIDFISNGTSIRRYGSTGIAITGVGNAGYSLNVQSYNSNAYAATSGTIGSTLIDGTFNPASGTGKFIGLNIAPTINQSGTATGDYTALQINTTESAATGTYKYLADFQTGGSSKFVFTSAGYMGIGTTTPTALLNAKAATGTSGSGTISSAGVTVTGSSTAFTTQLTIGDTITASGQTQVVTAIASDTSLTVDPGFSPNVTAVAFTYQKPIVKTADSSGNQKFMINSQGNIYLGDTATSGTQYIYGTLYTGSGYPREQISFTPGNNGGTIQLLTKSNQSLTLNGSGNIVTLTSYGSIGLSTSTDNITFQPGGAGNVGISTATPYASLQANGHAATSGTGTLDSSGTTVTGTSTVFTTQLHVGDTITASGQTRTVTAIASNTSLTTDTAFSPVLSGAAFTFQQPIFKFANSSGTVVHTQTALGYMGVGTAAPLANLESLATSNQLRLSYDASTPVLFNVGATGDLTIDQNKLSTSGAIRFKTSGASNASAEMFTLKGASGSTGYVGINNSNPSYALDVSPAYSGTGIRLAADTIMQPSTSTNNSAPDILTLQNLGSSTTSGVGDSILFKSANSNSNSRQLARLSSFFTTTTQGSERGAMTFSVAQPNDINSTTLAEVMRLDGNAQVGIGITGAHYRFSTLMSNASGNVAAITNTATTDDTTTNALRLNLGTADTGTSARFMQFYAGSTTDNDGTGVGRIRLNNTGVAYETGGADLAEYFDVTGLVEEGDLVANSVSGNMKASKVNDRVFGVVSSSAAFVGNAKTDKPKANQAIIGLTGQVKTKVSTINGVIHKGDLIGISEIGGVGAKLIDSGFAVGTALEDNFDTDVNAVRKITVLVAPFYFAGKPTSDIKQAGVDFIQKTKSGISTIYSIHTDGDVSARSGKFSGEIAAYSLKINVDSFTIDSEGNVVTKGSVKTAAIITATLEATNATIAQLTVDTLHVKTLVIGTSEEDKAKLAKVMPSPTVTPTQTSGVVPTLSPTPTKEDSSIGDAVLPANKKTVFIENSLVTEKSKVFLTNRTEDAGALSVIRIEPSKGFEVSITKPYGKEVKFDYWIVDKS